VTEALERITNLVALLLETRSPLTLDRIASSLAGQYPAGESALRGAFERDKALLREIGVPIDSEVLGGDDAGKTAYRIDRRRYELTDLQLTDDERTALQLAVAAARLSEGQFGLLKLGADGSVPTTVVANIPELAALPPLREATSARAQAEFTYRGVARRLHPYALLLREGFWYVIGYDLGHEEVRTYRVDRIDGDVSVGRSGVFDRPEGFDARTAFPSDPKLLGEEPGSRARVLIDAPRARAVETELGVAAVHERRADGSLVMEVPCANLDAFRSWLFGLGSYAEVLGPAEVRADVVAWLRAMAGAQ
jgi:proteasome accessory factor B